MASPQTENGFTRIANEILEAVQMYKFTLNEMKIVMCVWRYTYGFQRKSHELSLTFLMNHTGLGRTRINDSLKKLIEANVIVKLEQGRANSTNSYMFNKHYTTWKIEKYALFASVQNDTSVQGDTSVRNDTDTSVQDATNISVQNDTSTSVQDDTQERKVKESIKENVKNNNPVVVVDNEFADALKFYQENLQIGVSSSPHNYALLGELYDEFGLGVLLAAMKVAAKAEKRGVPYLDGILKRWREAGVKTIEDARKLETDFQSKKGSFSNVTSFKPPVYERGTPDGITSKHNDKHSTEFGNVRLFK